MTNREKYEQFRKLYAGGDPHREDHKRFDQLIRLLLDLPEEDPLPRPPRFKIGDFVTPSIGPWKVMRVVKLWVDPESHDARVTLIDQNGAAHDYRQAIVAAIPAFNEPAEELPF